MIRPMTMMSAALGLALVAGIASGQDADKALADATKARQAQMQLYAFNLGILGGMARGERPYEADVAVAAAGNLASLAGLDQSQIWPEGSDEMGVEGSRALPAAWENMADVMAKADDLAAAASAMQTAAGTDLAALQAAMGTLGGACSACHREYRVPNS
jgi:cytochrome c556